MALNDIFDSMKQEGFIIKGLDQYLIKVGNTPDDSRAIDVNAPSQAGVCMRSRYYARTGAEKDGVSVSPRLQRIFDNGTGVHERLQAYLLEQGMLIMDEIPVLNNKYNIQGHTDGLLQLNKHERGILEIKSINNMGFSSLRDAKEEHKRQGLVYIYCIEERRKQLHKKYKNKASFMLSKKKRFETYAKSYQHLKGGSKFTREEKINHQCYLHDKMDNILIDLDTPITKAVFLYENKDTQDLKEFTISTQDSQSKVIMKQVLEEYADLNYYVENEELPRREGKNKSDSCCKWCNFKTECWN